MVSSPASVPCSAGEEPHRASSTMTRGCLWVAVAVVFTVLAPRSAFEAGLLPWPWSSGVVPRCSIALGNDLGFTTNHRRRQRKHCRDFAGLSVRGCGPVFVDHLPILGLERRFKTQLGQILAGLFRHFDEREYLWAFAEIQIHGINRPCRQLLEKAVEADLVVELMVDASVGLDQKRLRCSEMSVCRLTRRWLLALATEQCSRDHNSQAQGEAPHWFSPSVG